MKNCFVCGEEISEGRGRIIPLDRPYVNLWVHRACADEVDVAYLEDNKERLLKYVENQQGSNKKK